MSLFKKISNLLKKDNKEEDSYFDNFFIDKFEQLPKEGDFPISQYQAFKLAEQDGNLKSDFFKNADLFISYLDFTDCKIELIKKDNKQYWLIKITDGDISSIYTDEEGNSTFTDGKLGEDSLKKLQCLIDVNTGEYIYYPE
ncbi:MAG: hypothetical protein IKL55_06245 [Clostridia bacterium]|nr:hypothetical protein [Clostridia bacterium]